MEKIIIRGCEGRGDGDHPYLTRWVLFRKKWLAIYFHKFHRSDADDLHDHPWNFISIILWRGYFEQTFTPNGHAFNFKRILPGTIIYRKSTHAHRVILIENKPAYTLVIRFKDKFNWGFYHKGIYLPFRNYFRKFGC
ncbi:hypothetical protein [Pedobacter metabolipauper]|uniref:Uncharacterized protein n=1 Tax=Pedobacter metabolipauper TaxID=425513 RepID=A0A4R6T3T1_9SPHI|nr:hypothetical protein [Pedobacter metabolipauper]TDQ12200.1 hypothetical protein ATK78_1334 [Pedobacter metabolipauper]